MIKKILVPFDGSATAEKSLKFAAELASKTGSKMILLHVIEPDAHVTLSVPAEATPTHITEPIEDYLKQAGEAILDEAEKIASADKVSRVIRSGHPVEEILKEAARSEADLIVLGSHGKNALEAAVLGSVTYGIIHKDIKFPVLVVRR